METVYLGSQPVAVLKGSDVYYVHTDHLNTPRAITNALDTVVWRWDSDPFGATAANEDPDQNSVSFTYNQRFPGQYYDQETGLHYNYFRDYDPRVGRYVQSDPIGLEGGINTYLYANGNPLAFVNPYGLSAWGDPIDQRIVDAVTGFGDAFLLPELVRDAFDIDGGVDQCSASYRGGKITGFVGGAVPSLTRLQSEMYCCIHM